MQDLLRSVRTIHGEWVERIGQLSSGTPYGWHPCLGCLRNLCWPSFCLRRGSVSLETLYGCYSLQLQHHHHWSSVDVSFGQPSQRFSFFCPVLMLLVEDRCDLSSNRDWPIGWPSPSLPFSLCWFHRRHESHLQNGHPF